MDILVRCNRPKHAEGKREFQRFEDLLKWLLTIKSLAKGSADLCLYSLAKEGRAGRSTARVELDMECSFHDYDLAREVAITTGLLRTRGLSDIPSKSPDVASAFARALDGRVLAPQT